MVKYILFYIHERNNECATIGIYDNYTDMNNIMNEKYNEYLDYHNYDSGEYVLMNIKDSDFKACDPINQYKFEKFIVYKYDENKLDYIDYKNKEYENVFMYEVLY